MLCVYKHLDDELDFNSKKEIERERKAEERN